MVSLFKKRKKTQRRVLKYHIPKKIRKRFDPVEKVDLSKYPLNMELKFTKEGKLQGKKKKEQKLPLLYRMVRWASGVVNRHPQLERIRLLFEKMTEQYVKETHFPYPSYAYSSLLAIIFLVIVSTIVVTIISAFISNILLYIMVGLLVVEAIVLHQLISYPKRLVKSLSDELGDILLMWYSVSKTGLPPQEQIKTIFLILERYRLINEQIPGKMKFYTFYYVFRDLYYDIELKNISLVNAIEKQVLKIRDERVKAFFLRLLRALRSGVDISDVIYDEIEKVSQEETMEIQKMGEKLYMLLQLYTMMLIMVLGMINVIKLVVGATMGPGYVVETLNKLFLFSFMAPIVLTVMIAVLIKSSTKKFKLYKDFKVSPIAYILSIVGLLTSTFVLPIIGVNSRLYLMTILFSFIPAILTLRIVGKTRKIISTMEYELPERLIEVSTTLNMGVRISDAFRAGVTTEEYEKMTFGDIIFLYISSYMNMGKPMREIFYRFIVKVPSLLARNILGIISFTEEVSGNFADFIGTIGDLLDRKLSTIKLSNSTISSVKMTIPTSTLIMMGILSFIISIVAPVTLQVSALNEGIDAYTAVETIKGPITNTITLVVPGRGTLGFDTELSVLFVVLYDFMWWVALSFAISMGLLFMMVNDYTIPETIAVTTIFFGIFLFIMYPLITTIIFNPHSQGLLSQLGLNLADTTGTQGMNYGNVFNTP